MKSLFLAKYLLKNTPDNTFAEKLLSRLKDEDNKDDQTIETVDTTNINGNTN